MAYIDINDPEGSGNNINVAEVSIGASRTSINEYNEVLSVASGSTTTVVTYMVPGSKTNVLERISVSGENIALYTVLLNGVPFDTQRTYFGGALNTQFEFTSLGNLGTILNPGDIISVTVLHNRPSAANFEGRIQMTQLN